MKIAFKLTLIMIVLSLVIVGAVGITLLTQSSTSIKSLSHDKAIATVQDFSGDIEILFTTYWGIAESLSVALEQYESIMPNNRRGFIIDMLKSVIDSHDEIIGISSIWEPNVLEGDDLKYLGTPGTTAKGRFAPSWHREGKNILFYAISEDKFQTPGTGDYYLIPKRRNQTVILDPYIDNFGGTSILNTSIATPIHVPGTNKLIGVVVIEIDMSMIQEISQSRKPFGNGLSAIFSNSGVVAAHFDPSRIGKNMAETERDMGGRFFNDFIKAINDGKPIIFTNFIHEANAEFMIFATPIKVGDEPWSYAIAVPTKTVMASLVRMQLLTAIICIIIVVLIIPIAIFISRSITRPIIRVADTLRDISEGEGDLTRSITINTKDEISSLAHYFNLTLEKIKNLVKTIKDEAILLTDIGTDLAGNMNNTATAVSQITANIQSIKSRVINQSASVTETNATMERITQNINKLNEQVEKQSGSVSQSSSSIEEMLANIQSVTQTLVKNMENVNTLTSASEIGRKSLSEVAEDVKEIARESEGLLEINSVMQNIASQTNLLSMNAAIEAAHAGDSGKGFAVVADEIRKLAENSSEQSKTISNVLKKITSSIEKITISTDNVLNKFETIAMDIKVVSDQEENIRLAMEEQSQGSKQILDAIGNLNEITQQVKDGSMEMLEGSNEVIHESKNLERVTQEISGGMNEMAAGADQINTSVNSVNDLSAKNRENINILMKEVSRFKIE
ncbi:MAG: methyl-accepting chemotaxis protein [Spirochaetaceae bacterium]|nr:methyl-accepting chemotaxis protein [Spirochaetaceae bacterium]